MKDFDSFYLKLTSEQAWFEAIQMTYRNKDYKQVAMECYTWLLTQPQLWQSQDYVRYRQSYQKFLLYSKDKEQVIIPPKALPVVIHPEALTGEAREKRLAEYLAAHLACEEPKKVAPLTARERLNGDVRPLPPEIHEPSEVEKRKAYRDHYDTVRLSRTRVFTDAYPEADEAEILAYLDQFKKLDDPLNLF